ncbi:MAG TPA: hypothetical protein PK685_02375 [archaeon]|jgi:hypothetical protein|nr:hypothetical protein [archaeon]
MKKGFTYIITVMILIISITGIILINRPNKTITNHNAQQLINNYQEEFLVFSLNDVADENTITSYNTSFSNYVNSYNYNIELCNIIESEEYIYFSNFTGNDCDLYIDEDVNQTINDKTTIRIDRFINNTNIYLCNCNYQRGKNSYYINIYNEDIKIIYEN